MNIITSHNGQPHQIDGIDFNLTPDTCVFKLPSGESVSVRQYFSQRYKIDLKERKQPLLFKNFRNIREYFPAELC